VCIGSRDFGPKRYELVTGNRDRVGPWITAQLLMSRFPGCLAERLRVKALVERVSPLAQPKINYQAVIGEFPEHVLEVTA